MDKKLLRNTGFFSLGHLVMLPFFPLQSMLLRVEAEKKIT